MSAALTGVSAVATSNELAKAPAMDLVLMAFLPSGAGHVFPAWTSCAKASPASANRHVSRSLGGACWGGNYIFMQHERADMRHRRHRPNVSARERSGGPSVGSGAAAIR